MANPVYQIGALEKTAIWIDADGDGNFTAWDGSITGGGGGTQYAEDTASAAGEQVMMAGVVRKDVAASLVDADGDRTELQVDANGALRVTGGGGGTEYTEDAASAANPTGGQLMLRRRDTLSALEVSADLDVIAANATAKGELYVKQSDVVPVNDNSGSLTVDAPVGTPVFVRLSDGAAAISALPITDNSGSLTVDAPVATPVAVRLSDGAAFISALPVTDNAGSLTVDFAAASASVNVAQVAGTAISVNSGNKDAGTQRVVIATDQPNLTTPLNVSAALTAGTNTNEVVGDVAEDAPLAGNPVRVGVRASTAVPTAMSADGDIITPWADRSGAQTVIPQPRLIRLDADLTVATSGYVAGDQVGSAATFTSGALASGRAFQIVQAAVFSDTPTAKNDLILHVMEASPTFASIDNGALDLTDANMDAAKFCGAVKFAATDYVDTSSNAWCFGTSMLGPVSVHGVTSGSANIFGILEMGTTIGAQYGAATDVRVSIWVLQY